MAISWENKVKQPTHNQMPVEYGLDTGIEDTGDGKPPKHLQKVWARVTEGPDIQHEEIVVDSHNSTKHMYEIHKRVCDEYVVWHVEHQKNITSCANAQRIIADIQELMKNGTSEAKSILTAFLKGVK